MSTLEVLTFAIPNSRRVTAMEFVRDTIRTAILRGDLRGGSRLLRTEIASQLRVSTTPVREAMRELASEGLISLDSHRTGTVWSPSWDEIVEIVDIKAGTRSDGDREGHEPSHRRGHRARCVTDEGSKTELASRDVPEEFLGQSCVVIADATNNVSTHPDNDFLVESGQSSVLLPDVERASGGTILGVGRLILGPTIVVSLIMGPDEVFSEGIVVVLECEEVVTTTTAPVETTTIPDEVLPTVVTTIPDEVLPTVVTTVPADPSTLPFTGSETEGLALVAVALGGTGILFLVATRGRRQD